jgi:shikimate dehydrogenase
VGSKHGTAWRVGVIGDPVAHSISPVMQQAALDALGIDATYEAWQTPAAELAARITGLREADVLGANVTVPHKQAVMPLLDEVSPLAMRAGAVNTIVQRDGSLAGDNTDVHGFATALLAACPNAASRYALVLGAGGAARAVVLALEAMGLAWIALANRNAARAESLARDLEPTAVSVVPWTEKELARELARCSLLVNATSLGWHRGETPVDPGLLVRLPRNAWVVDLTYRDTDLLEAARARGLSTLDGLGMLVHQGARALELWTDRAAPVDVMMDAARRARAERA